MDLRVRMYAEKKIEVIKSFQKKATPAQKKLLERGIDLTQQSAVQHGRIQRIAKVFHNTDDEKRVRKGGLSSAGVQFPRGADLNGTSADKSYQKVKDNYRLLAADVKSSVLPEVRAAMQPQATNMAALLSAEVLGRKTITDFNGIIKTLDVVSNVCKVYGKVTGDKAAGTISDIVDYAKQAVELYAPIKFNKDLPKYVAALDCWVMVGNQMIDYIDPKGAWSFYDFR